MLQIKITPRFVRQDKDGLRPFQRKAIEAIKNPKLSDLILELKGNDGKEKK